MEYTLKCKKCSKKLEVKMFLADRDKFIETQHCECGGGYFNKITNSKEPFWKCTKHTYIPGVSR